MRVDFRVLGSAVMLAMALPVCTLAGTITIQFNELPTQTVSATGLSVNGVTFSFTGGTATFGDSLGVGSLTQNLTDPVLDGDTTGTLTLNFAQPTSLFSFDFALDTANSVQSGYSVALYNQSTSISSQAFDVSPANVLAESVFSYSGSVITSAVITFPNTVDSQSNSVPGFAIDNVTFESASPEPGTFALIAGGVLALVAGKRRIQR